MFFTTENFIKDNNLLNVVIEMNKKFIVKQIKETVKDLTRSHGPIETKMYVEMIEAYLEELIK